MQLSLDDANDAWQDGIFLMYLTICKGVFLLERVMQSFISKSVSRQKCFISTRSKIRGVSRTATIMVIWKFRHGHLGIDVDIQI